MTAPRFSRHAALAYRQRFGIWPHEAAGLRETRLGRGARRGLVVSVYDGIPAGMDVEGGRWQTVCETHGFICSHETLGLARSFLADPEAWCEDCASRAAGATPDDISAIAAERTA